jgi:hypothetical protein
VILLIAAEAGVFELPPTFYWSNEMQWDPVAQIAKHLLPNAAGERALHIQETVKLGGRPVDLSGMLQLGQLRALKALATARPALALRIDGRADMAARFRFDSGAAVDFKMVGGPVFNPAEDQWYEGVIKLIGV